MKLSNLQWVFSNLKSDGKSDIKIFQVTEGEMALYAAELKAAKKLPAHYHRTGTEVYHILGGNGVFEIGQQTGDGVWWTESLRLKAGDVVEVPPGTVHRLLGGSEDMKIIFIAPPAHLGEDRVFVQ